MNQLPKLVAVCLLAAFETACVKASLEEPSYDEKIGQFSAKCVGYFSVAAAVYGERLDNELQLEGGDTDEIIKFYLDVADKKIPNQNSARVVRDAMYEAEKLVADEGEALRPDMRNFLWQCSGEYYKSIAPKVSV